MEQSSPILLSHLHLKWGEIEKQSENAVFTPFSKFLSRINSVYDQIKEKFMLLKVQNMLFWVSN